MDEHKELAKQAISLYTSGYRFFRWDIKRAILLIVNEQPELQTVGDVDREALIDDVTAAVEELRYVWYDREGKLQVTRVDGKGNPFRNPIPITAYICLGYMSKSDIEELPNYNPDYDVSDIYDNLRY